MTVGSFRVAKVEDIVELNLLAGSRNFFPREIIPGGNDRGYDEARPVRFVCELRVLQDTCPMSHRLPRKYGLPTQRNTSAIGCYVFAKLLLCPGWSPTLEEDFEPFPQTSEGFGHL